MMLFILKVVHFLLLIWEFDNSKSFESFTTGLVWLLLTESSAQEVKKLINLSCLKSGQEWRSFFCPRCGESDVIVQHFKPDLTSRNCVTYAIAQVALQREKGTIKGRSDDGDLSTITQCSLPTEKAGGFYFVSVGKVSLCMCRQSSPVQNFLCLCYCRLLTFYAGL